MTKNTPTLPLALLALLALLPLLTSCFKDEDDYKEWREQNEAYVAEQMARKDSLGNPYFTPVEPSWYAGASILMRWHNDRQATQSKLSPLYNSTCNVKYKVRSIVATVDSSYSMSIYGDSIYQCQPSTVIPGFGEALMVMHEGDSATVVIPYQLGYGSMQTTTIKPYSTLIYDLKLVKVTKYQLP